MDDLNRFKKNFERRCVIICYWRGFVLQIVTKVMKMTPSGPVRMGITPLARQPVPLTDGRDGIIQQRVITVSYNAGAFNRALELSPRFVTQRCHLASSPTMVTLTYE